MRGFEIRPHLYSIIAIILFSTIEVVGKLIGNNISPYAITFWRFLIGGLILLPYAFREMKKQMERLILTDYLKLSGAGILIVCISMLLLQLSVFYGKAALSAVIVSSNPLFVAIFAFLILREYITKLHIIGLIIGLIGLILIILGEIEVLLSSRNLLLGIVFGLVAALTFALYTIYSKTLIPRYGNMTTLSFAFIMGAFVLLIYSVIAGEAIFFHASLSNLFAISYLGLFVTGIAYILYFQAIIQLGAAKASIYFFLKPAIATFLSWLLLKEMLNTLQIIGILMIMISLSRDAFIRLFSLTIKPSIVV